jgi:hypothetical protein
MTRSAPTGSTSTGRASARRTLRAGAAGLALCVALAVFTGCTADDPSTGPVDEGVPTGSFRLVAFDSCDEALGGLRSALSAAIGPNGPSHGPAIATDAESAPRDAAVPQPANGAPGAATEKSGQPQYSGTTTHEQGVDEPDLVKTDGRRIVTVSGGVLRVVDAASKRAVGKVSLGGAENFRYSANDLLLAGDHALVLVNAAYIAYSGGPIAMEDVRGAVDQADPTPGRRIDQPIAGPLLMLVDIVGPPRVLSRLAMDGALVDARQVGSIARVVVRSAPRITFPYLENTTDTKRTKTNQEIIARAGIDAWTPRIEVTTGGATRRMEIGCDAISRPASYTGASLLTVLSFDLRAADLNDGRPTTLVADGDTVYSNGPSLYVATDQRWRGRPDGVVADGAIEAKPVEATTEIYRFDTTGPDRPRFVAGGSVRGYLLNQYAMSEWDGHLRVATTTGETWVDRGAAQASESGIHVLTTGGGKLTEIGKVEGMGKGERIYAVRFLGPIGYVVTFRQTDPLYTVDLSVPTRPAVRGALKIPGYSAYLHPAEDARLIGIGQAATEQGRVTGTQVSLFDVADLTDPTRVATYTIDGSNSQAEFNPHAFLYWPAERMLVVPLQADQAIGRPEPAPGVGSSATSPRAKQAMPLVGALVLRIAGSSINRVGFLTHPYAGGYGYDQPIERSLVIDQTLWTVSQGGVMASDIRTLERQAWIPFS